MEPTTQHTGDANNGQGNGSAQAPVPLQFSELQRLLGQEYEHDLGASALYQLADDIEIAGRAIAQGEGYPDAHLSTWRIAERARAAAELVSAFNEQQRQDFAKGAFDRVLLAAVPDLPRNDPHRLVMAMAQLLTETGHAKAARFARSVVHAMLSNERMDEWIAIQGSRQTPSDKPGPIDERKEIEALQAAVKLIRGSLSRGYFGEMDLDMANLLDMAAISLERSARYVVSEPEAGKGGR